MVGRGETVTSAREMPNDDDDEEEEDDEDEDLEPPVVREPELDE